MSAEELPQWQAACAEMLRPKRDGETIYEMVTRELRAAFRMDDIREAFDTGVCPTCGHGPATEGEKVADVARAFSVSRATIYRLAEGEQ